MLNKSKPGCQKRKPPLFAPPPSLRLPLLEVKCGCVTGIIAPLLQVGARVREEGAAPGGETRRSRPWRWSSADGCPGLRKGPRGGHEHTRRGGRVCSLTQHSHTRPPTPAGLSPFFPDQRKGFNFSMPTCLPFWESCVWRGRAQRKRREEWEERREMHLGNLLQSEGGVAVAGPVQIVRVQRGAAAHPRGPSASPAARRPAWGPAAAAVAVQSLGSASRRGHVAAADPAGTEACPAARRAAAAAAAGSARARAL